VQVSPRLIVSAVAGAGGSAALGWNVPADPALAGAVAWCQGMVVDPRANAGGMTSTNGLKVTLR
jgi:hypothetical protein